MLHLHRVREPQGWQLLGAHNIHFYLQLMRTMRRHILEVFDAEPPFTPRGCVAQAWSVAEVLRCLEKTAVAQE